jgi:hypothetical protein
MLIGFAVAGKITDEYTTVTSHSWQDIWLFPAGFAAIVLVIFLVLFKSEKVSTDA